MSEIKPVLRQMIDNNKPHWRPETIRGAHKMLDEYEAKAKAWDAMKKDFEDIADTPMGQQILFTMSTIKERVESGERDA